MRGKPAVVVNQVEHTDRALRLGCCVFVAGVRFWQSRTWDSFGAYIMGRPLGEGLRSYYKAKIEELEIQARDKQHNLRRLEAQRNDLNGKGQPLQMLLVARETHCADGTCVSAVRMLREELQLLQEPGSYVGEVIKVGAHCCTCTLRRSALLSLLTTRLPVLTGHGQKQDPCQGASRGQVCCGPS